LETPRVQRTNGKNQHFNELVCMLDASLAESDGDEHDFYNQFNGLENINHVIVVCIKKHPIACGAIKRWDDTTAEVKRMFTKPEYRGKGIGSKVVSALESWAKELGFKKCIIETGKRQPDAIALYDKTGYSRISNYGPYTGKENSVCFQKFL